ncbi:hypothetical protein Ciccas_000496 [Cichlidogyrus casuarinus]|uniref:Uncharacterized protein n=1 Tax=Cichlidogyrus casuarinus TaxID=1844966 RepID=A0ABD2QQP4_9PLAT
MHHILIAAHFHGLSSLCICFLFLKQCERYGKFIRAAILEFMVDLFGNYRKHLYDVFDVNEDNFFRDNVLVNVVCFWCREVTKLAPEIDWPLENSEEVPKNWEPVCYHGRFPYKTLNLNLISEIRQAKCRDDSCKPSHFQSQPTFERVSQLSRQFDKLDRFNLPDFPDLLSLNPENPLHKYAAYLTRSQNEIAIGRHQSNRDPGFLWAKHLTYNAYCLWYQLLPSYLASLPILAKCTITNTLVDNYLETASDGESRLSFWLANCLANDRSMLVTNQAQDILLYAVLMYSRMFPPAIFLPGDCVSHLSHIHSFPRWHSSTQKQFDSV